MHSEGLCISKANNQYIASSPERKTTGAHFLPARRRAMSQSPPVSHSPPSPQANGAPRRAILSLDPSSQGSMLCSVALPAAHDGL